MSVGGYVSAPFTLTEGRVTFHETLDVPRTPIHDISLLDLVKTGRKVTLDLSNVKWISTEWVRLMTTLTIQEGADVLIVGANKEALDTAEYLGHLKHWRQG